MLTTLFRYRKDHAEDDQGFTLIELLVTVVILGVLLAVAIPVYLNYRKGAYDSSSESDLRNAINVMEQCSADNGRYPNAQNVGFEGGDRGTSWNPCANQTVTVSKYTRFYYQATDNGNAYVIVDGNLNGKGVGWCYDSSKGGAVTKTSFGVPGGAINNCY